MDLRWSAYGCVATKVLNYSQFVKQVMQVNWDVSDLQSQHSIYVDSIISVSQKSYFLIEKYKY